MAEAEADLSKVDEGGEGVAAAAAAAAAPPGSPGRLRPSAVSDSEATEMEEHFEEVMKRKAASRLEREQADERVARAVADKDVEINILTADLQKVRAQLAALQKEVR